MHLSQIGLNKEEINYDKIKQVSLFVLAAPRDNFTKDELEALKKYVESGGNLLVLLAEGG